MTDKEKRYLGIGAVGIVGFLLYSRMHSGGTAASNRRQVTNAYAQASHPVGSTTPYTPQSPIVVPQGESIYDPNSENLLNTPTAIPQPQATTPSAPAYVVNVNSPRTHRTQKNTKRATKRAHGKGTSQTKHVARKHKPKVTK